MKKSGLIIILFLICTPDIFTQVVSSGKVSIRINNLPVSDKAIEQRGNNMISDKANDIKKTSEKIREVYGDYYALIIGINNYRDTTINKQGNSIEDASLFQKLITTRYTFEKDNVSFLKDATLAEIKSAFDYFSKKVSPNDNFLIFYSGRSFWDLNSAKGFWLPSDAQRIGFWVVPTNEEENDKRAWLSNNMLGNYLQKIKTKHTLLITDACFGGDIYNGHVVSEGSVKAIDLLNELPGKKAITRGMSSDETVPNDFIEYLNNYLEKNVEEYLPSEKLYINFSKTFSNDIKIKPQFGEISNMGDEGGDFIFILRD